MANDHKTCMSEVVTHLLSVKNSKVIAETKYDEIVEHLQRPNAVTDPKLRWWIKRKRFQLISFPELDIADVLVIPKRGTYINMLNFLSFMPDERFNVLILMSKNVTGMVTLARKQFTKIRHSV